MQPVQDLIMRAQLRLEHVMLNIGTCDQKCPSQMCALEIDRREKMRLKNLKEEELEELEGLEVSIKV